MANAKGTSRLARILDQRMREHGDTPLIVDYGKISNTGSLITNSYDVPIPKEDYLVCEWLTGKEMETTTDGYHPHNHRVRSPRLQKGDKVLVVWVQDDPIVLDRLVFGDDVFAGGD